MKKAAELIKNIFSVTAGIYLVVSLFIMITFLFVDEMDARAVLSFSLLSNSLLFSFLSGLSIAVIEIIPKIHVALKFAAELILCYGSLYLTLFYMTGNGRNFSNFFSLSTIFIILFVLINGIRIFIRSRAREKESSRKYEKVYTEITGKK